MSRPIKTGMDYFPHDVDASADEKIEALRVLYGNDGYAFYFISLERIYRTENAELDLSKEINLKIIAGKIMVALDRLKEMISVSLDIGCFDRTEYETRSVLTSPGIKRRFNEVVSMRERWRSKKEQKNTSGFSTEKTTEETGESKVKKRKAFINGSVLSEVDEIYALYPDTCPIKGRATGKCQKDKNRLASLLNVEKNVRARVAYYLNDCKKHDIPLKNLGTLLSNLPNIPEEQSVEEPPNIPLYFRKLN